MKFKVTEVTDGYLIKSKDGCMLGQLKKFPSKLLASEQVKELISKIEG